MTQESINMQTNTLRLLESGAPRGLEQLAAEGHRAWTRLPSGRRLDLISPDAQAWTHSLQVLEIARQSACRSLTPHEQLRELLHDAEEAWLGFDCLAPLKPALGAPFRLVSDRLTAAIWERYELPIWDTTSYGRHKDADEMSAASEAVHSVGWSVDEVRTVLGIEAPILQVDPLAEIYGSVPWRPWSADIAAERFLTKLQRLIADQTSLVDDEGVARASAPKTETASDGFDARRPQDAHAVRMDGWEAGYVGVRHETNPHPAESFEWSLWRDSHREGMFAAVDEGVREMP
jgi:hypothetical protein